MGPTATLQGVAPVLLVRDVVAAAVYWRERVGFAAELHGDPPNFALVRRDGARLMLAAAASPERILPNWKIQSKCNDAYVWVDDARALYDELVARGATIDFSLYDTPWGTREFGIQDEDDHDIAFGQVLR